MRGTLHMVGKVPVYIEQNSDQVIALVKDVVAGQDGIEIDHVTVGTAWSGTPWIKYHLRDPDIEINVGKGHAAGQLQEILERNQRCLSSYARAVEQAPDIDAIDAFLAMRYAGPLHLRKIAKPFTGKLRISIPLGDYADSISRPVAEIKFPDGRLIRTGSRISTTLWLGRGEASQQSWDNRSLLIPARDTLPQAVIIAMSGRKLDEVVSNTILAGNDLVIKKAWQIGGRLGFSFAANVISLEQALAMRPNSLPHAA